MARNTQISRIYALLDLLDGSPSGFTVSELHEKAATRGHKVGKRTIYRDLEALSQSGFPLFPEGEDEATTRWRLERQTKINQSLVMNARELFALYLARGALLPLKETPFYQDLHSIFQKLEQKLGTKQTEYLDSLQMELKFEPSPQWGLGLNPDILETVRVACSEGHVIECTYYSVNSKKESTRKLGPHYLYYARGGLYLVAEDLEVRKVKVFAMPRMKQASMCDEEYKGEIQTPEEFFDGAFSVYSGSGSKEVIIEFDEDISQYVSERKWHQSQRLVNKDHGKVRVTFEVAETPELVAWILGFGPSAKVMSPDTLAEKVAVMAMKTTELYKKKSS